MNAVDMELFELLTDGDKDFALELVEMWETKSTEDLTLLNRALDSNDSDAVVKVAHSLKGASANLGAVTVQSAAKRLEAMGREGDLSMAASLLERLAHEIERAKSVYQDYFSS